MANPSHSSADRPGPDERAQRFSESAGRREDRYERCPDPDRLQQGLVGQLPASEQALFERHVLQCPRCFTAVEQLRRTDSLVNEMRECAPLVEQPPEDIANSIDNTTRLHSTGDSAWSFGAAWKSVDFLGNERFRIEGELGAGGMGTVYQAYDRQRDERVALKVLHGGDDAAILRLTREFRTLADLAHPNLVTLYELYAADAVKFFTMELIEGCDFLAYFRGESRHPAASPEPLSESEVFNRLRKALGQLAAGLEALHAAGKLHRDIKPSNVLVAQGERLVLVDFGVASEIDLNPHLQRYLAGTAAYMSPEQAARGALSPASDWYSVGVMLFQALTGQLPFSGPSAEVLAQKQRDEPPRPGDWAPHLPADLETLCTDLLRARPEERPAGAEVMARLHAASPDHSHGASRPQFALGRKKDLGSEEFVGRNQELELLRAAFETAAQGRAMMARITGPCGVGKTALSRKFLEELTDRQTALVLEGRCYEREILPFKAADQLIDALANWLKSGADAEILTAIADELAFAARLFPTLQRVPAIAKAFARVDASARAPEMKQRALAALRELFIRMTARLPMVLFVDDLQWGDADSPALFAELLRGPCGPRVLFLVAFRDESEAVSPWLQSWRDQERQAGFAWSGLEVKVRPLPPHDARVLAARLLRDSDRSPQATDRAETIARESSGHPLFIRQLLLLHTDAPPSEHEGQVFQPDLRAEGSQGLWEQSLWKTIEELPPDVYRLLEAAAVAGYPLGLDRALRVAGGTTPGRERMNALVRANLLRTVGAEPQTRLVVYHDRIRETLVSRLTPEALRDAHRRLALAASVENSSDAEALVLHYQGAGEVKLAAKHAVQAADRAAGKLAFDLAIRCYRLALELSAGDGSSGNASSDDDSSGNSSPGNDSSGDGISGNDSSGNGSSGNGSSGNASSGDDDRDRELQLKLAESLANAGRGAEAAAIYLDIAATDPPESAWRLRFHAGEQLLRGGRCKEALETLTPLFRQLGLQPPTAPIWRLLAAAIARRAWLRLTGYRVRGDGSRAASQLELDRADLFCRTAGYVSYFDFLRGFSLMPQAAYWSLKCGEPSRVALALVQEGCFAALVGELRRAETFLKRGESFAQRHNDSYALAGAFHGRGICGLTNGNWRAAIDAFETEQALHKESRRAVQVEASHADFLSHFALVYSGELQILAQRVSERLHDVLLRRELFGMAICRSNLATMAWLALDRSDEARHQLDEAVRDWPGGAAELPHGFGLNAALRIDLYEGAARSAWDRMSRLWKPLVRSGALKSRFRAGDLFALRAACGLAAAAAGVGGRSALHTADNCAKRLEKLRVPWTTALAQLTRAGALAIRGQRDAATEAYRRAAESLDAAQMPLHAAAARLRLGPLLGDSALVADAQASLARRGVAEPDRMARLLAPDCRTGA